MLFSELCAMYLADKRNGRKAVRPNTYEGYESAVNRHILPRWSQVEVESVTCDDVQSWVDSFPDGRGAEKSYKTLRQCIRWAIARRVVTMADPTVGVEVPKPRRRSARVLDDGQLNRMLYACKGEPWEAVVWCQACLGLRRCEAVALTWADIDLRSGVVHVTKGRHVVGGKVYVWGTKTPKSTRDVVLPRFAVERLRAIRRERRARADELLCDLRPDAIGRRFRSWCRRNGFDGLTMMQLRHTWATLSVRAGVPIEVVAMALGHTGVEMAYSRYVSRSIDVLRVNVRKFADLVLRAAPDTRLVKPMSPALVA
jgi:integrase